MTWEDTNCTVSTYNNSVVGLPNCDCLDGQPNAFRHLVVRVGAAAEVLDGAIG